MLRFLLYGAFLWGALVPNAPAVEQALRVLCSRCYWAPAVPSLALALGLLAACLGYALWLSGATLAGWKMPLFAQTVPIALFTAALLGGPLQIPEDPAAGLAPADRAIAALQSLARLAERGGQPCSLQPAQLDAALAASPSVPATGYRSFGRAVGFHVVRRDGEGAVKQVQPGDDAGTIYLACDPRGRAWLSAVVTETLPAGPPALVRDGVGKVAVLLGEALK